MPYREDLEASLARAAAVEDELAAARRENAHDHERIAELEKELLDARRAAASQPSAPSPRTPQPVQPSTAAPPRMSWRRLKEYGWPIFIPVVVAGIVIADEIHKAVAKKNIAVMQLTAQVTTTRIDVMAEAARARADARTLIPDAALVQIDTQRIVDSSGLADLTKGFVTFDFYSPSKRHYIHAMTKRDTREVTDFITGSGMRIHDPPQCSIVDVWAEAIRRGASPTALASIRLRMTKDGPTWSFELAPPDNAFTMTLPDQCPR